jgi:pyruvate dehydrogenase E2 component (dihydrolipoamide acetyltransferase)
MEKPATRSIKNEHQLSPTRRTIASRLYKSYNDAIHVTLNRNARVPNVDWALERLADNTETAPSIVDVILKSVSTALNTYPGFNATYDDEKQTHRVYKEHNIGTAVDTDNGLVVPVLNDIRNDSIADIHGNRQKIMQRVQSGSFNMSDLENGTFTISNLGPLGIDSFNPIINPPQIAILGIGRMREQGGGSGQSEDESNMITLSLSFDHRVVDGADGARFLREIINSINNILAEAGS